MGKINKVKIELNLEFDVLRERMEIIQAIIADDRSALGMEDDEEHSLDWTLNMMRVIQDKAVDSGFSKEEVFNS